MAARSRHMERYGKPVSETVIELPDNVRALNATPRIIRGLFDFMTEDRLTWDQIREMGALNVGLWNASIA